MGIKRLDHVNFVTHDPQATVDFYCDIIGLSLGSRLSIDTSQSLYFHIPGDSIAILHVGNAKADKNQPKFKRLANLNCQHQGAFSTGAFDHFCLALDMGDYDTFVQRLGTKKLDFQTYCHKDMAISVQNILLGNVLNERNKQLLLQWMRNNTTGYSRIRAGVPPGWVVADKTGSGSYGIANDIGLIWSPSCKPIILSIYTHQNKQATVAQDGVIADITKMVLDQFSKYDSCFEATNLTKIQTLLIQK